MDLQQDVNNKVEQGVEKIVSFTLQAGKLTEEVFKELLAKGNKTNIKSPKEKYSTTSIGEMTRDGKKITVIGESMLPDVAKRFYKYAGRKKIPFSMLADNSTAPPTYHLCIYKSHEGVFKNVVQNFLKEEADRKTKPSLRKRLQVKIREAKEMNANRQAERGNHERSR
jgi:hypothetical protein